MNLLLDTHVLLWWLDDPTLLSKQALTAIKEPDKEVNPSMDLRSASIFSQSFFQKRNACFQINLVFALKMIQD